MGRSVLCFCRCGCTDCSSDIFMIVDNRGTSNDKRISDNPDDHADERGTDINTAKVYSNNDGCDTNMVT